MVAVWRISLAPARELNVERAAQWTLVDLALPPPYVGALAVRGHGATYELRDRSIT